MIQEATIESPATETVVETPTAVETPVVATETPTTEQRPEYVPEKFWKDGKPDLEGMAKSYQSLESAFHTKHPLSADLPASPAEYALAPEKLPDGMVLPPEVLGKFQEVFHAKGVGQAAAKEIVNAFVEMEAANFEAATKAYQTKLGEDKAALVTKWGGEEAYNARKDEIANLVTEKLGADPNDAALFSNPRVVEFLAKTQEWVKAMEKQLGEDAKAAAKGSMAPGTTFTNGADEANRIMRDASHPDHAAYMAGDTNVQKRVLKLLGAE